MSDDDDCRDQSVMDCTNQGPPTSAQLISLYIFCSVIALVCLILITLWMKKRDYFPIRERSPYLIIIFILGVFIYEISQPVALIYTWNTSDIPSGGIGWDQLTTLGRVLSNAYFLGVSIMICSYLMRALRLSYAFEPKRERSCVDSLYAREWLLCLVVLVGSGLFLILYLQLGVIVPFFHNINNPEVFDEQSLQVIFLQGGLVGQVALFMFMTYLLRNVRSDYNFSQEMLGVTAVNWVFQATCLLLYESSYLKGCVGLFSKTSILYALRGICFLGVTAVYPLFISVRGHFPLTPAKAMDEFRYYIMDELCVRTYMNFLKELDTNNDYTLSLNEIGSRRSYTEIFLFFLEIHRINILREDSPGTVERIYALYIQDPENSQIFPQDLRQEVTNNYQQTEPARRSIEIFCGLYQYAYNILQSLYEKTYLRTNSFLTLRERFRRYELVNEKLCKLNMISNS